MGYSLADVRVAHYRWNPRRIELPHPVAYSNLVETIGRLWESDIAPAINTDVAQFTVRQHSDGRIASMEQSRPHLRPGVGRRFRVRADIAAFYDSIYSHAIPWALMGKPEAKLNHRLSVPANELDAAVRMARRGETTGISVGPGSSLIIAELLLSKVDAALERYRYERFLDDYVAYTRTETEAEEFVRDLDTALRGFGLQLNGRKTSVESLPAPEDPGWLRELRQTSSTRPRELIDRALELSRTDPQASAIQWALSRSQGILMGLSKEDQQHFLQRLAELSFSYPHTTPVLARSLLATGIDLPQEDLDTLIQKHASDSQSSAVCWLLHLAWETNVAISEKSWEAVRVTNDSLGLAYLLQSRSATLSTQQTALRADLRAAGGDAYTRDEAWPVRYIAYLEGVSELQDPGFEELREGGVALLRDPKEFASAAAEPEVDDELGDDNDDDMIWGGGSGFSG